MSVWSGGFHSYRPVRWGVLGLAFVLVLVTLGVGNLNHAYADGGLPVTPTFTPSPTVMVTPTDSFILLPTNTPVPQLLLLATNTPFVESGLPAYPLVTSQPSLLIVTQAAPGPNQDAQPLICWALPIALIIVFIIVVSSLGIWRRNQPA